MGYRLKNRAVFLAALLAGGFAAATSVKADGDETLTHFKRPVWGCVDPKIATLINDEANPNHNDASWIAQTRRDGDCISISTSSAWAAQGPDFNGLTYVAYRGTDQKSRSFWVPTDALDLAPQVNDQQAADTSSAPAPQVASPTSEPATTAQPDTQTSNDDQGGGLGIFAVIAFIVFVGLWRRARRRKGKPPQAAKPAKVSRKNSGIEFRVHPSSMAPREQGPPEVLPPSPRKTTAKSSLPQVTKATVSSSSKPASVPSVSFQIHTSSLTQTPGQPQPVQERPKQVAWYFPGATASVLGFTVADGMIYVGTPAASMNGFDASFIDPNLAVAPNSNSEGPLGYWPSYSQISPDCRRRYLEWLAQGKRDPFVDLGYVFIYFYGLERRLLLESPKPDEARTLIAEIERLRTIYTQSNSFNGYSARLIEAGRLVYDRGHTDLVAAATSTARPGDMSPVLKLALAGEAVAGRPIGLELAVIALCGLSEFWSNHKHIIQKSRSLFLQVFQSHFRSRFPLGLTLKPQNNSKLSILYRGATTGLVVDLAERAGLGSLPDPASFYWTDLLSIGTEAAKAVTPYSNAASRYPGWQNSLAALVDCPPELKATVATDGRKWAEALPAIGEFKFSQVAKNAIGLENTKWTAKHRREIGAALAAVGYAMEPGPDEREQLEDSTPVQVFRYGGGALSRNAEVASAAAMLVAAIAKTAANATARIESFWVSQIPSKLMLTRDETTLIRARLAWLRTKPIGLAKTKRLLEDANPDEKAFCAWSATVAVGAVGAPDKSRVALLEAMYDALGVPRSALYVALHAGIATATAAADDPIVISEGVAEPLHIIPQPPSVVPFQAQPPATQHEPTNEPSPSKEKDGAEVQGGMDGFVPAIVPGRSPAPVGVPNPTGVNFEKLAKIRAETERTAALLAQVFVEDDEAEQVAEPPNDGPYPGLDGEYTAFLTLLLTRAEWSRDEFDHAASAAGLMPDGAMEAINEWAFDHLDNPLLEDGDPVIINHDLLAADAEAAAAD